jgi:hypothetical protein
MPTALEKFLGRPTAEVHPAYQGSILAPVAPEYTTGEGLIAAAYRTLLLGVSDSSVDLSSIDKLPDELDAAAERGDVGTFSDNGRAQFIESWRELVTTPGGLSSPIPAGSQARLRQLMPLVPRLGYRSGVIGAFGRNRWQPGTLLLSALGTGGGPTHAGTLIEGLRAALRVERGDDLLARYVEGCLAAVHPDREAPSLDSLVDTGLAAAAWRADQSDGHIPAERFVADLAFVLELKPRLTRRQWTTMLEAQLRIGLSMHQMWLCNLNVKAWGLARRAMSSGAIDVEEILATCWRPQEKDQPFLELGADSMPAVRRLLAGYARARLGLNLILFVLGEIEAGWSDRLGASPTASPAESLAAFLAHVAENGRALDELAESVTGQRLIAAAGSLADRNAKLVSAQSGVTRNLLFFLRYSLGQLQTIDEEQASYDQGFLVHRPSRALASERPVRPGPATLIMLVHTTCRSMGRVPASMDALRRHLAAYGLAASADELRNGSTVRELESLGLVVDSPDAGGGRLLADPLAGGARIHA